MKATYNTILEGVDVSICFSRKDLSYILSQLDKRDEQERLLYRFLEGAVEVIDKEEAKI